MTSVVDGSPMEKTRMAFRMFDMAVHTKTFTKGGLFSKVLNINAKSGPEKRIIKVQASAPFKPPGRPSSFLFDSVYESEVFEDKVELAASLLAEVSCPNDMDSKIRVNVYYMGSLTNQKEILICSSTFSLRDLRREESGIMMLDFHSEHIQNAVGYVEIVSALPQVLSDESLQVRAPVADMNPLFQKYVFYREGDNTEIACDCEEYCWEPRLAFKMSSSFVEGILTAILESREGWIERKKLEELRQGIFKSDQHAASNGWHKLGVSVSGAYIKLQTSGTAHAHHDIISHHEKSAATLYVSYYPLFDQNDCFTSTSRNERDSIKVLNQLAVDSSNSVRSGKGLIGGGAFDAFSRTQKKKVDESTPSTYVEIYYENPDEAFSIYVGRTNTEYHTLNPAYGSCLNDEFCKKSDGNEPTVELPTKFSKIEKNYQFVVFETTIKGANPLAKFKEENGQLFDDFMRPTVIADGGRKTDGMGGNGEEDPNADKVSQMVLPGYEPYFYRYVPNNDAQVRFDLYFEEYGGNKNVKVGTTTQRLGDVTAKQSTWLKMTPLPLPPLHGHAPQIEFMEVLVSAEMTLSSINMPSTSFAPNFLKAPSENIEIPAISPVVAPAAMPYALEMKRCANGHRVMPTEALAEKCQEMVSGLGIDPKAVLPNYMESIAKSYEWYWHVGFLGLDPLVIDTTRKLSSKGQTPAMIAKNTPAMKTNEDLEPKKKSLVKGVKIADPDDAEDSTPPTTPTKEKEKEKKKHGFGFKLGLRSRTQSNKEGESSGKDSAEPEMNDDDGGDSELPSNNKLFDWSARQTELDNEAAYSVPTVAPVDIPVDDTAAEPSDAPVKPPKPSRVAFTADTKLASPPPPPPPPAHGRPMSMPWSRASDRPGNIRAVRAAKSMGSIAALGGDEENTDPAVNPESSGHANPSKGSKGPAHRELLLEDLNLVSENKLQPRVDFHYPISWIDMMIDKLDKLYFEMFSNLNQARLWCIQNAPKAYRSSTLKKDAFLQHIPTNLHYQVMTVRNHSLNVVPGQEKDETAGKSASELVQLVDSVTCGCASPHGLGHKKGGLHHIEGKLLKQKVALDDLKEHYHKAMQEAKLRSARDKPCVYPNTPEHELFMDVGKRALAFEEFCFDVCRRRLMSISQALSTVIQCVLLKLSLVAEGHIEKAVADKWLQLGFLIVFEGLLSVAGHERSMLEDTITALEAVDMYSVRLLPSPKSGTVSEDDNCTGGGRSKGMLRSVSVDVKSADVSISGREVQIFLPEAAVSKMPESYQTKMKDGGAVMPLSTVLFTQGIDIQQSMATGSIFSRGSSEIANLQLHVNLRGLYVLHKYCCKAMPVDEVTTVSLENKEKEYHKGDGDEDLTSSTTLDGVKMETYDDLKNVEVHPLLFSLCESIKNADATAKNVDMLVKVEEACLLLNGCRVTFCKSGKDRTGMAVSLDQSRQLGERFGCGESLDRTIRDVQLMRLHGTRIGICEKNIGRPVYSINKLQVQFLPLQYRPPASVCESILKKDNS